LRDSSRGSAWEITGPAVTSDRAVPAEIYLGNGGSVGDSVAAYTNEIEVFGETPDVLIATYSGRARISDATGHDYPIRDTATFCLRPDGCECPQDSDTGRPPPLPLDPTSAALAVTGGTAGATGSLDGLSLKDYCSPTIAGTWTGTWQNDNGLATGGFTLVLTQKGKTFSGTIDVTGPTCVGHGTVQGTVDGKSVNWGTVGAERDVDFTGTFSDDSMSGTWAAIACGPPYGPANVIINLTGTWQATRQE
jgi:hypothetical protein